MVKQSKEVRALSKKLGGIFMPPAGYKPTQGKSGGKSGGRKPSR